MVALNFVHYAINILCCIFLYNNKYIEFLGYREYIFEMKNYSETKTLGYA